PPITPTTITTARPPHRTSTSHNPHSHYYPAPLISPFFFFNDTATTEIYTLSLHDALPISVVPEQPHERTSPTEQTSQVVRSGERDRKSTRLNSSHSQISYAVFCLKKKKKKKNKTKNKKKMNIEHGVKRTDS